MAISPDRYMNFTNLQQYDGLIKDYVDTSVDRLPTYDAQNQSLHLTARPDSDVPKVVSDALVF